MGSAVVEEAEEGTEAVAEGEDMGVEEEENGTVTAAEEDWGWVTYHWSGTGLWS